MPASLKTEIVRFRPWGGNTLAQTAALGEVKYNPMRIDVETILLMSITTAEYRSVERQT